MMPEDQEVSPFITMLLGAFKKTQEVLSEERLLALHLPPSQEQLQRWISLIEEQRFHAHQRFTIMALGEFSAGKSTLINAMLELPPPLRLPSGDGPVTDKPARFSYTDSTPYARLLLKDGTLVDVSWEEAIGLTDQRERRTSKANVKEVQFFLNHPLLVQADILDLPGTGTAEFDEHTLLTRDYLDNVEMVLWVIGETEPSREGSKDLRKALNTGVPIAMVFNVWGSLLHQHMEIDQEDLEDGVLDKFPEVQDEYFRVHARKSLETQTRFWEAPDQRSLRASEVQIGDWLLQLEEDRDYQDAIDGFGVTALRDYLLDNYLSGFEDRRFNGRLLAEKKASRLAWQAHEGLVDARQKWLDSLEALGEEGKRLVESRKKLQRLKARTYSKISQLAQPYTERIQHYLVQQLDAFIDEQLNPTNWTIWRNIFNKEQMQAKLGEELRANYLYFGPLDDSQVDDAKPDNWLVATSKNFLNDAQIILEAEWGIFLGEMELETVTQPSMKRLDFSPLLKRLTNAASETVKQVIFQTVMIVIKVAVFIYESFIAFLLLLLGKPWQRKIVDPKEAIKKKIRAEVEMQEYQIKNSLVDLIMGPDGIFRQQERIFLASIEEDTNSFSDQKRDHFEALDALNELLQTLESLEEKSRA